MKVNLGIKKPSEEEVEKYLKHWDSLENYSLQESSLKKLFTKTYPSNLDLDDVLIKVCALNTFYSTNIFSPFPVAKRIVGLKIDQKLSAGDLSIVSNIASVTFDNGKTKNFYSFATKYCSHHNPTAYPIYDLYVTKMLMHFMHKDHFDRFTSEDLRTYQRFKAILLNFKKAYDLESFDLKQIDKYLWQAGKEYFPRKYGKVI